MKFYPKCPSGHSFCFSLLITNRSSMSLSIRSSLNSLCVIVIAIRIVWSSLHTMILYYRPALRRICSFKRSEKTATYLPVYKKFLSPVIYKFQRILVRLLASSSRRIFRIQIMYNSRMIDNPSLDHRMPSVSNFLRSSTALPRHMILFNWYR